MQLNINYLIDRHTFWKYEIDKAGIWNAQLFKDVTIKIRKHHRRFNGVFIRKKTLNSIEDKIVIYNKSCDFEPSFIDSVLVHEMIHQYLIQNDLAGKTPHGRPFKEMMNKINVAFEGKLKIAVKSTNPSLPLEGPGDKWSTLLVLSGKDYSFCFNIYPEKMKFFEKEVKKLIKSRNFHDFIWLKSNDIYFTHLSRCLKRLHGIKLPNQEMKVFLQSHNCYRLS